MQAFSNLKVKDYIPFGGGGRASFSLEPASIQGNTKETLQLVLAVETAPDSYCGIIVNLNEPADARDCNAMVFNCRGRSGDEVFEIKLKDKDGREGMVISSQLFNVSSNWQLCVVPLALFQGVETTSVTDIVFASNSNQANSETQIIEITDLEFTSVPRIKILA